MVGHGQDEHQTNHLPHATRARAHRVPEPHSSKTRRQAKGDPTGDRFAEDEEEDAKGSTVNGCSQRDEGAQPCEGQRILDGAEDPRRLRLGGETIENQ